MNKPTHQDESDLRKAVIAVLKGGQVIHNDTDLDADELLYGEKADAILALINTQLPNQLKEDV